ncbi:MAG: response regulator [Lachnospiraceae bacterium]|nr:response regulator [Lachnospiraceae bacterium]
MEVSFGYTLKTLRTERNISQQQLADKLYVNRSSIANWESGRRTPDLVVIARIARILNVDVSVLTSAAVNTTVMQEVIIVDDETILLSGAIPILSEAMPEANITGFSKVSEAISYAKKHRVSIAFLDIEIGKVNGLDLCDTLLEINPLINIIFLTSYPDYAISAWGTKASGFLVKPLHLNDVKEQLAKLRHPVGGIL